MEVTAGDINDSMRPVGPQGLASAVAPAAVPVAVTFEAADGYTLGGELLSAAHPRGGVLIAGATGVPSKFYRGFAQWLCNEHHLTCLIFDYRGIGRSLQGPLRESKARLQDWGQLDLPAALDLLQARSVGPRYLVGHSAGGQLVGLMPNIHDVSRIVQVACSSGYFAQLQPRLRLTARLLMQGYLPLSNQLVGYAACKAVGWGEDLPREVARQWTQWCARPGYVENAFGHTVDAHHYDTITAPMLNLSFVDDPIATEANIEDLLRLFPRAQIVRRRLGPEEVGGRKIGHINLFRRRQQDLWPLLADFLLSP